MPESDKLCPDCPLSQINSERIRKAALATVNEALDNLEQGQSLPDAFNNTIFFSVDDVQTYAWAYNCLKRRLNRPNCFSAEAQERREELAQS